MSPHLDGYSSELYYKHSTFWRQNVQNRNYLFVHLYRHPAPLRKVYCREDHVHGDEHGKTRGSLGPVMDKYILILAKNQLSCVMSSYVSECPPGICHAPARVSHGSGRKKTAWAGGPARMKTPGGRADSLMSTLPSLSGCSFEGGLAPSRSSSEASDCTKEKSVSSVRKPGRAMIACMIKAVPLCAGSSTASSLERGFRHVCGGRRHAKTTISPPSLR